MVVPQRATHARVAIAIVLILFMSHQPFRAFLRLHKVRGRGARFLTEKILTDVLGLSAWRRTAETFVKHDRLPLYFAKSQVWPLFVERKNDIIQVFSLGVVVP